MCVTDNEVDWLCGWHNNNNNIHNNNKSHYFDTLLTKMNETETWWKYSAHTHTHTHKEPVINNTFIYKYSEQTKKQWCVWTTIIYLTLCELTTDVNSIQLRHAQTAVNTINLLVEVVIATVLYNSFSNSLGIDSRIRYLLLYKNTKSIRIGRSTKELELLTKELPQRIGKKLKELGIIPFFFEFFYRRKFWSLGIIELEL